MPSFELFKVRVTAKDLRRRKMLMRAGLVILLIVVLLLAVMFFVNDYINRAGRFTVDVLKEGTISLSESVDFTDPSTYLMAEPYDNLDNITEEWIDANVDEIDGPHNGNNYIAYTFYLRNVSDRTVGYKAYIDLLSSYKGAEEAMRVKIYKNGTPTVYAKRAANGEPEPNTTPFYSETKVMSETYMDFKPGDTDKYTVVIWLEGWDPECVNKILTGSAKMAMNIDIIEEETVELGQGAVYGIDDATLMLPTVDIKKHFKINK